MRLNFTPKQTEIIVGKEVKRLKADGISKLLFGNNIADYCEPEIPDSSGRDLEELRFTDAETEILVQDYIKSLHDPYATLTALLGTDDFVVDEVMA